MITGADAATVEIALITVRLHLFMLVLENKRDVYPTDIHLASMRVQPEKPTVESLASPIAYLGLHKPMAPFPCLVSICGGIVLIEEKIHAHLGIQGPFSPRENSSERLGVNSASYTRLFFIATLCEKDCKLNNRKKKKILFFILALILFLATEPLGS